MNRNLIVAVVVAAALAAGYFLGRAGDNAADGSDPSGRERDILYWVAPMDANYRRDEPGKSPMGMDLVPVYADEAIATDPALVTIDPTVVNNLGVRSVNVERGPLSRKVETVGYVSYDEGTLVHIHSRVDGWIERLAIKAAGDPVERGQLLYELYSPTLVNAQEEYLAALGGGNTNLQQASRRRLEALGVTGSEIDRLDSERRANRLVSVFADGDGYAVNLGVREGIYITPTTDIMSIARLDDVWVLVEVFERQASWIQVGQQAEVELDYVPGQSWQGSVDYVYPELDPQSRTLKVRLRFDNQSGVLRPNMFARITIFGSETAPVVHVPREALIRGGTVDRVVVALGGGRFRAQPVDVGIESGNRVEIRAGLSDGEQVVTSGQFLIDSESNIESALARMGEEGPEPLPGRVQIGAVVRGVDLNAPAIRLQHEPVPEWSWPSMTMSFNVDDRAMIEGLTADQPIEVVIEKLADGRHRITEILPSSGGVPAEIDDAMEMDHSGNDMNMEPEPMDHSMHDMEMSE